MRKALITESTQVTKHVFVRDSCARNISRPFVGEATLAEKLVDRPKGQRRLDKQYKQNAPRVFIEISPDPADTGFEYF